MYRVSNDLVRRPLGIFICMNQIIILKVAAKTHGRCFYCNRVGEVIDHFISKKKWLDWGLEEMLGSCDDIDNLFLACQRCNSSKKDNPPEDFIGNSYKCWDRYYRTNSKAPRDVIF